MDRRAPFRRRLRARFGAITTTALIASVLVAAMPQTAGAPAQARPVTQAAAEFPLLTLTADTFDAVALSYVGTFDVSTPSGPQQVLRFTMASAALGAVVITHACIDSLTTVTSAHSASLTGATLDVVSFAAMLGDTPVTFTVAAPPTTPFPGEVVLQQLSVSATTVSADSLTAPSLSTQRATCVAPAN